MIASIQFPETYVREKALDILGLPKFKSSVLLTKSIVELANGLGAEIKTELIRGEKTSNGHVAYYDGEPKVKGDVGGDKRTAKKNLVYKLLQVLLFSQFIVSFFLAALEKS